ncbi:tetratricopeptide repeat protein [Micromonospora sp. WMMD1102]|uniref:tetratricopeptide repeat protein n=1 Tax=Micromonospora sp. WMMD1102 TaxID=3016105 RepID=UPI002414D91C|nr:tetratricopeptide repeat protein [Micromonospora sp. WMMD1102]MDG4789201.1 tetratricopeptide repeat protein [Micromonospora sp. WMMD1102]
MAPAAQRFAPGHHLPQTSIGLAFTLARFLGFRRYFDDWITITTLAADICRQLDDRRREGGALNNLGLALAEVRRFDEAITAHTQAAEIYRQLDARHGEGGALNNLGIALQQVQGEHGDLLGLAVGAGQLGLAAVVDGQVRRLPLLDDLQPFVDLAAQGRVGEVVGDERRPHRPTQFLDRGEVGCFGPRLWNRRRICSASAVPSCNARAYLIIWSYCWVIRSQLIARVRTGSRPGYAAPSCGRYSRAEPMFFNRGSSR